MSQGKSQQFRARATSSSPAGSEQGMPKVDASDDLVDVSVWVFANAGSRICDMPAPAVVLAMELACMKSVTRSLLLS